MKPGRYNLPTIWRGSTYDTITFTWLDINGNPIDLTGWIPHATSLHIDLNPQIVDVLNGVTSIGFTKQQTPNLRLGVEIWDWIFEMPGGERTTPLLQGIVEVKDPATTTTSP
jgi:hypothetical protein